MTPTRKLVIVGTDAFATLAHEYFARDSAYEVVGFATDREITGDAALNGLPVVAFDRIAERFDPAAHDFFAAIEGEELNRRRTRLYRAAKALGYAPASYVSSDAFVWRNVQLGEHCFILENNVVQPFATLGDNVVLWSGNHIGHHSTLRDHCFVGPHAVISGFVELGESSVVSANVTFANNLTTGEDCYFGPAALVSRDVAADSVVEGQAGTAGGSARRLQRVTD